MKQNLIITIRYQDERPDNQILKIVQLFDKSKEVNLSSDDYTTELTEPNGVKSFAINFSYKEKDFKTAVYEILRKANRIGEYWTIQGPVKAKTLFFIMNLENDGKNDLPKGIIGYRIILNSEPNYN